MGVLTIVNGMMLLSSRVQWLWHHHLQCICHVLCVSFFKTRFCIVLFSLMLPILFQLSLCCRKAPILRWKFLFTCHVRIDRWRWIPMPSDCDVTSGNFLLSEYCSQWQGKYFWIGADWNNIAAQKL